jgi:Cu(I)/Ag(I) efflux system membrane protein CusA/SilA
VVPELADPQIALVADWMGHPARTSRPRWHKPLTAALADVPGSKAIRGSTMTGMAYVDVVFESASGLDAAHREIAARVERTRAKLPPNVRIYLGPTASTTGWVFEYALTDRARVSSLLDMRRFQEDVLKPALAAVPGVAEIASVGGDLRQVRIDLKPREMRERGLAYTDVLAAVRPVFQAPGSGLATGVARVSTADLEALPIVVGSETIRLRDVALVREGRGHADRARRHGRRAGRRRHRHREARRRHRGADR